MVEPTSGLFWWSAETISTFMPLAAAPKSSTAIFAATTAPGPDDVGIQAGHVVHHADLDHAVGDLRLRRRSAQAKGRSDQGRQESALQFHFQPFQLHQHPAPAPVPFKRRAPRAACRCLASSSAAHEGFDHLAVLDHVEAVGQRRGEAEVLLHHHDGQPLFAQRADGAAQRLHDHRRQAFGDLVQQQQLGAGAQDARHRQHLLLATRQAPAGAGAALLQVREHRVDLVEAHAARGHRRWQQQVLLAAQAGEDAALLGAVAQPELRDAVRRQVHRLRAVDHDRAGAPAHQAHDRLQRGGAAGAVAAQQRDDLALVHRQVDAVQDVRFAVPGVHVGQAQHFGGLSHGRPAVRPLRCPCRPPAPAGSSTPPRKAHRR